MQSPAVVAELVHVIAAGTQRRALAFGPLGLWVPVFGKASITVAAGAKTAVYARAVKRVIVTKG